MRFQGLWQIGFHAILLAALAACGGSSETTVGAGASPETTEDGSAGGAEPRVADLSLREVDWEFCQEGYPDNCYDGTAIVWLSPERVSGEIVEPEATLSKEVTGYTIALKSYGCFPEYEEPQDLAYYDLTVPVLLEGEAGNRLADAREIAAQLPVEVLDVRPLSDETVKSLTGSFEEGALPPIALTSGDCEPEDLEV